MYITRIQYNFRRLKWNYDIEVGNCLCLVGENGSGKTLVLSTTCALTEALMTGSMDPIINLLVDKGRFEKEWRYIFDEVRIQIKGGRYIEVKSIDPFNGEFRVVMDGKVSMLPSEISKDYNPTIPFLSETRHDNYGETIGKLLELADYKYPKDMIDHACKSLLDKEAYPKYFSPMPDHKEYKTQSKWYWALDDWLGSFSHGEKEMMCFSLAVKIAKSKSEIMFIDGFGSGIHMKSQEVISSVIPSIATDCQIIYSTHYPFMLLEKNSISLSDLNKKEKSI